MIQDSAQAVRRSGLFVPFLGDFFSMKVGKRRSRRTEKTAFRPLSRGLFFNSGISSAYLERYLDIFVPFLGDFFSICSCPDLTVVMPVIFVPFLGDFFQYKAYGLILVHNHIFVPFLGDFFSIITIVAAYIAAKIIFVPFLGDFFSISALELYLYAFGNFRPLSRGLFFNGVPAKPQPVCSRERIRGGDGWVASSGTLLRR